jgi:aryl-alcohol dehydrogenase-like predicted oxidoreductase
MKTRKLGTELEVFPVGLGCMGMSFAYGGQAEADAIATLRRAVEIGVTFFDTAEVYGPFENEILLGKALKPVRDKVTIATKFGFKISEEGSGIDRMTGVDSRPEHVKAVAEASLKRLDTDVIDLYYQHRVDPNVPIEDTVGAMAELVRDGKVRALGLSEVSAATIRRAHAVHPIAAVQSEYSLWSRDPEDEVFDVCRELGIGFVPYSPLGRGLLTGTIAKPEALSDDDWRRTLPRFQADAMAENAKVIATLERLAAQKGVTSAQLALAWVLHQGDDLVPIPGTKRRTYLEQNALAIEVELTAEDLAQIDAEIPEPAGARYDEAGMAAVNR